MLGEHPDGHSTSNQQEPAVGQSDDTGVQVSLSCSTFWAWEPPVSPHLAAQGHPPAALQHLKLPAGNTGDNDAVKPTESQSSAVGDAAIVNACRSFLAPSSDNGEGVRGVGGMNADQRREEWVIVETAGGVLSPAPSGNLQADAYRYCNDPCFGHAVTSC